VREGEEEDTAQFLESYADYLRSHLEDWMVTTEGSLVPGIKRYYIRLNPAKPGEVPAPNSVNTADLPLTSRAPGAPTSYPARNIVDGGFLQLVRYGIVAADDPVVKDTLKVVDATIKAETPYGPSWRRYNHDGYGQRADGSPYVDWGTGRPWPLLTGERGHYELAAGHDVRPFLKTMEQFGSFTGLLDEQVWDEPDKPEQGMYFGKATQSAAPLLWAHSEYIRLLRSTQDGKVFDVIDEVAHRYLKGKSHPDPVEFWLWKHQTRYMKMGRTLRVCLGSPFRLRWTDDNWATQYDTDSHPTSIGAEYVDLLTPANKPTELEFTFFWPQVEKWEGKNFQVTAQ
jgi:glucoamylase